MTQATNGTKTPLEMHDWLSPVDIVKTLISVDLLHLSVHNRC